MNFEDMKFLVVEDKDADREEVLNRLARAGFKPENLLGKPAAYDEALEMIEHNAAELDVVFLDLNLPRHERDIRPEKKHGFNLLEFIHNSINARPGINLHVIVISGEDLLDGVNDQLYYSRFRGTLVSIANKADIEPTLKASLKRLGRDPLVNKCRRLGIEVVDEYEKVKDSTASVRERLEAARTLAIRLVRYEAEYTYGVPGCTDKYADDLHGLIKEFIEERFEEDNKGKQHVKASALKSPRVWGSFLWRGAMSQYLRDINSYRNLIVHMDENPYKCSEPAEQTWSIPPDVLIDAEKGDTIGQIVMMMVLHLLQWYIPWHEQVYLGGINKGVNHDA